MPNGKPEATSTAGGGSAPRRPFRVLSIDGGGIRGILPGMVLVALEEELQRLDGPTARLADYFDLIAGTSTGGILACLYLVPAANALPGAARSLYTASDAVNLYLEYGDDVFDASIWHRARSVGGLRDEKYPADGLESVARRFLGDTRLSELRRPTLITAYDIQRRRATFFTQHDAVLSPGSDFLVRDVARATSAAPTYFEVAKVSSRANSSHALIDGGVFANNPAMCAFAEATAKFGATPANLRILSIGTGSTVKAYDYKVAKDWGQLEWAIPIIDILMSSVAETVDYQLRQLFSGAGAAHHYVRIDPALGTEASQEMDDATFDNVHALERAGRIAANHHRPMLQVIARDLVGTPAA